MNESTEDSMSQNALRLSGPGWPVRRRVQSVSILKSSR